MELGSWGEVGSFNFQSNADNLSCCYMSVASLCLARKQEGRGVLLLDVPKKKD